MLSRCANSGCNARFRYLYEGKVFFADWVGVRQDDGDICWRQSEMFRLCSNCCDTFALSKKGSSVAPVKLGMMPDPGSFLLREVRISR